MNVFREKDRWICRCDYHTRHVPKSAGFRWNPKDKVWWTDSPGIAVQLQEYMSDAVLCEVNGLLGNSTGYSSSRARDSNADFECPAGLIYMPFQKAGIEYALDRKDTIIADEMGLGKTVQAIGFINEVKAERVLIICPASLKLNWKRELERWLLNRDLNLGIVTGGTTQTALEADIVIMNYELVGKHRNTFDVFDVLVCDEAHYLKNGKAQRTAHVLGGKIKSRYINGIRAKRRLFLTGTPIMNRPVELYPMLKSINRDTFGEWWEYTARYCDGHEDDYGHWKTDGASNLKHLRHLL